MPMAVETVHVNLGERSYDIVVTSDDSRGLGPHARTLGKGTLACLVTDTNASPLARTFQASLEEAGFRTVVITLPAGEATKSLASAEAVYDRLIEAMADRQTLIVAIGGGVVGDLAGFVAGTFARGVPLLMVPTTLLAMVDSSVGGKTGVNHPRAKNMIGVFHQPVGVWIDTATLQTLPDREYRSGLAEVVKYGVILDADFFAYVEKHAAAILSREPSVVRSIVARSCRLKADVVELDERETTGLRAILNYGHTFAHAFETVGGYGAWLHGEAVAAGMICASRLADRRGLIPAEATSRQRALLLRLGLPVRPQRWPVASLLAVMRSDKKSLAGKLRFILPTELGHAALVEQVAEEEVVAVLEELMREEA